MARKKRKSRKTNKNANAIKKSSGSNFGLFIVLAVFAYIGYSFFSDSPSSNSGSDTALAKLKTYALNGAINSWPNIQNSQSNIVPYSDKKNLLAKNYYIVLDASGSMEETNCANGRTKMQASIDALEQFIQNASKGANVGLSVFHRSEFKEKVKLSDKPNWKQVMQELRQTLVPKGGTPLATATAQAQLKLEAQARKQLGYGEYNLVLITDGLANPDENPSQIVEKILQISPVNLNVIGFCIGKDNILNQPGFIQYRTATDPKSLKQSLQDVLAESPDFNVSDFAK